MMDELMADKDPIRSKRITDAMLKMIKLDIAKLQAAYDGKSQASSRRTRKMEGVLKERTRAEGPRRGRGQRPAEQCARPVERPRSPREDTPARAALP
ncbi:hypothetical protein [Archangium lansingense]|uniref:Uncharacterized protein n=1 Tax=Archangium lansingense TaxID=2995310 RepID=A0ABT4A3B9_9BACT|nr:hypothetical protein [Archangium lansinium]MCY1075769.1 hypothetical protein [Archangium lansinium]